MKKVQRRSRRSLLAKGVLTKGVLGFVRLTMVLAFLLFLGFCCLAGFVFALWLTLEFW